MIVFALLVVLCAANIVFAERITRHDDSDELWQRRGMRPAAWLYGSPCRYRVVSGCGVVLFGWLLLTTVLAR